MGAQCKDKGCCWGLRGSMRSQVGCGGSVPGLRRSRKSYGARGACGGGEGDISTWEDMGTQPAGAECCSGEGKMWAAGETLGYAVVWGHRGNGGMWGEVGGKKGGCGAVLEHLTHCLLLHSILLLQAHIGPYPQILPRYRVPISPVPPTSLSPTSVPYTSPCSAFLSCSSRSCPSTVW